MKIFPKIEKEMKKEVTNFQMVYYFLFPIDAKDLLRLKVPSRVKLTRIQIHGF